MKNKRRETKLKSGVGRARHLMSSVLCLGALTLICSSAPAQNLFVTGWDGSTGVIYEYTLQGARSTFASGLMGPSALAFDSAGNLFVADTTYIISSCCIMTSGAIYKFSPDGVRSTFALGLSLPLALAFDSAGNLFVADDSFTSNGPSGNIYKFTPDGVRSTFASSLTVPSALAFDGADNLFVGAGLDSVTTGIAKIYKFTPGGRRTTFASGLTGPTGLAFDSAGNLFVADDGDIDGLSAALYKFTPNGKQTTIASVGPFSLAFDGAGNLFVADDFSRNILKFTPSGVQSTFAPGLAGVLAFQPTQGSPPPPPIVAIPSVSPDGGKFRRRVMVTLTDVTPGTTIYYTLDGSDPTTTSFPYLGAFMLMHSATVKTIAVDSSGNESGIATALFTIKRR